MLRRALAVLILTIPAFAQYAGPAILSRGEAPSAMSAPQINFRPYFDVNAVYDTGLAGVTDQPAGRTGRFLFGRPLGGRRSQRLA